MNVQNPIIQPRPRLAIDGGDPVVPSGYVMMSRWRGWTGPTSTP